MNVTFPIYPCENLFTNVSQQHHLSYRRPSASASPTSSDSTNRSPDLGYEGPRCKGHEHPQIWSWNPSPADPEKRLYQGSTHR